MTYTYRSKYSIIPASKLKAIMHDRGMELFDTIMQYIAEHINAILLHGYTAMRLCLPHHLGNDPIEPLLPSIRSTMSLMLEDAGYRCYISNTYISDEHYIIFIDLEY